jgi:arginine deiminase
VEQFAQRAFAAGVAHTVLAVPIAQERATMHLDTVCTMVDVDAAVMYPPVADSLQAYVITPANGPAPARDGPESLPDRSSPRPDRSSPRPDRSDPRRDGDEPPPESIALHVSGPQRFLSAAAAAMGIEEIRVIGTGLDPVTAEREQWDDGNNTLCIAPRLAVAYERNVETNARLEAAGIEVLPIAGSELGSGRGGPRCMSCPVWRDPPE